jgi:ribosome-associated heat shock protein Hsp15
MADDDLRLDKWLWAARFFRTRALAADAIAGGKVKVNGNRVKPAKAIRVDDDVQIHIGPFEHRVRVRGLSDRRGPASTAAMLYDELPESKAARAELAVRLAAERAQAPVTPGRPTKRARRELIQLKKERR